MSWDRNWSSFLSFWLFFVFISVLQIRDPMPFWPLDPGSGMVKKVKIRIRVENPGSHCRELWNNLLGWNYFNLLTWIRDPESFWPWTRDRGWKIRICDKNPGSATMDCKYLFSLVMIKEPACLQLLDIVATVYLRKQFFGVISTHRIIVSWSEGSGSGSGGTAKPPGGGADKGGGGASANKFKGVSGSQYKFGVLARYRYLISV